MDAMKKVLVLAAVSEAAMGLALLVVPSLVGELLFGAVAPGIAVPLARVTGIALIALAVACWPDRKTVQAFFGMLTFGLLAMLYLTYLGVSGTAGVLLWPAVAAHGGLSVLLVFAWRKQRRTSGSGFR